MARCELVPDEAQLHEPRGGGEFSATGAEMLAPRSAPAQTELRPIAIYMSGDLRDQLRAAKDAASMTYAEWILRAFDAHYDQLDVVYPPLEPSKSPLAPRPRIPRRRPGKAQMVQLDMRSDDLHVLDDTTERLQIPNRNELLVTVIELELGLDETKIAP